MQYTTEAKARIAGEYVLGVAPRPLARAVRRRMRRDPALAAEVARWEEALHSLGDAVPATLPMRDAAVWSRIAEELTPPARSAGVVVPARSASPAPRSWWQQLWVWQGWAVAASAVAVVLVVAPQLRQGPAPLAQPPRIEQPAPVAPAAPGAQAAAPAPVAGDAAGNGALAGTAPEPAPAAVPAAVQGAGAPPTRTEVAASGTREVRSTEVLTQAGEVDPAHAQVASADVRRTRGASGGEPAAGEVPALVGVLADGEKGGAAWLMRYDPQSSTLRLRVIAEQSAGQAKDFELWAVPKDGGPPRSLGLISGSQDTALHLDARAGRWVRQAQVLAVSVEPAGGSPAEGPTGPVKYTGAIANI